MKPFSQALVILLAAGTGLALGFLWRGHPAPKGMSGLPAVSPENTNAASAKRKRNLVYHDDSPLATQLAKDLAISPAVTKWLYWMTALEKARPADFPRLAKLARDNPAIWRCVVNRWIETAPLHLFNTLVAVSKSGGNDLPVAELGRELFDRWARVDPEAAVAALTEQRDLGEIGGWRRQVAETITETKPERGLGLMSDWHIENFGPRMDAINQWAANDPVHAAEFTLAHPAGYASQLAMDAIGRAWAKTDPTAAMSFAEAQPNELGSRLATTVLQTWADKNLNQAAEWLSTDDENTRNRLSPAFIETWGKQDASGALSWCEENLQGLQLAQAVNSVMKGASQKDVQGAAALVNAMEPGPAKTAAAEVVAQKWFPDYFSSDSVKPEAISWLSNLDKDSIRQVLGAVSWNWVSTDTKSMAAFLAKANNDEVPPFVDSMVATQIARNTPQQALDWATTLPGNRALAAGQEAFTEWQQAQPETALAWVEGLPSGDTRRQPFLETVIKTLAFQPQGPQDFSTLPLGDQQVAQNVIATMTLPEDQRSKLMSALKLH